MLKRNATFSTLLLTLINKMIMLSLIAMLVNKKDGENYY